MGKKEIRMNRIVEITNARGYIPIKEMAKLLQVSEMTVRRDISVIENSGFIRNVNGILMSGHGNITEKMEAEYDILEEFEVRNDAKTAIGRYAATLIEDGDFVIFDTGTTTEQILPFIRQDISFGALCFNRNILEGLCQYPKIDVALAGGYYNPRTQMFCGEYGVSFIKSIRANKVFVSAAGIHENLGISCANNYEVATKKAILQSAKQHILVADSSKFGVVRSSYFCNLEDIDTIITDNSLSEEWCSTVSEKKIYLKLV